MIRFDKGVQNTSHSHSLNASNEECGNPLLHNRVRTNHPMLDICTHHQQEGMCIYFAGHLFINHPLLWWIQGYEFVLQNQYLRKYGATIFVMYIWLLICSLQTCYIDQNVDQNILFLISNFRFMPIFATTLFCITPSTYKLLFSFTVI